MSFRFIRDHADRWPIRLMCRVIEVSASGCCPWRSRPESDNDPMESSFHTLEVELARQLRWPTREDAKRDLFAYIEGYYNRRRIHSALGYKTPEQAERQIA